MSEKWARWRWINCPAPDTLLSSRSFCDYYYCYCCCCECVFFFQICTNISKQLQILADLWVTVLCLFINCSLPVFFFLWASGRARCARIVRAHAQVPSLSSSLSYTTWSVYFHAMCMSIVCSTVVVCVPYVCMRACVHIYFAYVNAFIIKSIHVMRRKRAVCLKFLQLNCDCRRLWLHLMPVQMNLQAWNTWFNVSN